MERGDDFFLRAFADLGSCRQFGMSSGPIPWDKILLYGTVSGLEPDVLRVFTDIIRALDETYLEDQQVQEEKRRERDRTKGRRRRSKRAR